jgi:glycosyltransferase involved in cell wall biosynthesis
MKATIIIPALNPEIEKLTTLVTELKRLGFDDFIIVNDGSNPEYEETFQKFAKEGEITYLRHAINLGKGAALKTAFNEFLYTRPGRVAVTVDADGQHAPEDILKVASAGIEHTEHLVLGNRTGKSPQPFRSRFGNKISQIIFRMVTGVHVDDTQTGLRVWPGKLMLAMLKSTSMGYDFETESLLWGLQNNIPLKQISIQKLYFDDNRLSHFNPIRDSILIYWVIVRFCLGSITIASFDYFLFMLMYNWTENIPQSIIMSRAGATVLAFFIAKNLVFKEKSKNSIHQFIKFVILVALLGALSISITSALAWYWEIPVFLAKAMAESILLIVSFTAQRQMIFSRRLESTDWEKYYEKPFPASKVTRRITEHNLIRAFRNHAGKTNNTVITELGGANSSFAKVICKELNPLAYHIYDTSPRGLALTSELNIEQIQTHRIDITLNNIWEEPADIVFSVGLIEHFNKEGTQRVIKAHFDAAKDKALIILIYPTATLLYKFVRKTAEFLGLWDFPDERPLKLKEVAASCEPYGRIIFTKINWLVILTQEIVVIEKN